MNTNKLFKILILISFTVFANLSAAVIPPEPTTLDKLKISFSETKKTLGKLQTNLEKLSQFTAQTPVEDVKSVCEQIKGDLKNLKKLIEQINLYINKIILEKKIEMTKQEYSRLQRTKKYLNPEETSRLAELEQARKELEEINKKEQEEKTRAAVEIQRIWRGYQERKKIKEIKEVEEFKQKYENIKQKTTKATTIDTLLEITDAITQTILPYLAKGEPFPGQKARGTFLLLLSLVFNTIDKLFDLEIKFETTDLDTLLAATNALAEACKEIVTGPAYQAFTSKFETEIPDIFKQPESKIDQKKILFLGYLKLKKALHVIKPKTPIPEISEMIRQANAQLPTKEEIEGLSSAPIEKLQNVLYQIIEKLPTVENLNLKRRSQLLTNLLSIAAKLQLSPSIFNTQLFLLSLKSLIIKTPKPAQPKFDEEITKAIKTTTEAASTITPEEIQKYPTQAEKLKEAFFQLLDEVARKADFATLGNEPQAVGNLKTISEKIGIPSSIFDIYLSLRVVDAAISTKEELDDKIIENVQTANSMISKITKKRLEEHAQKSVNIERTLKQMIKNLIVRPNKFTPENQQRLMELLAGISQKITAESIRFEPYFSLVNLMLTILNKNITDEQVGQALETTAAQPLYTTQEVAEAIPAQYIEPTKTLLEETLFQIVNQLTTRPFAFKTGKPFDTLSASLKTIATKIGSQAEKVELALRAYYPLMLVMRAIIEKDELQIINSIRNAADSLPSKDEIPEYVKKVDEILFQIIEKLSTKPTLLNPPWIQQLTENLNLLADKLKIHATFIQAYLQLVSIIPKISEKSEISQQIISNFEKVATQIPTIEKETPQYSKYILKLKLLLNKINQIIHEKIDITVINPIHQTLLTELQTHLNTITRKLNIEQIPIEIEMETGLDAIESFHIAIEQILPILQQEPLPPAIVNLLESLRISLAAISTQREQLKQFGKEQELLANLQTLQFLLKYKQQQFPSIPQLEQQLQLLQQQPETPETTEQITQQITAKDFLSNIETLLPQLEQMKQLLQE